MHHSLNKLLEEAVQIAFDYLEKSGEVYDAQGARSFLTDAIEDMVRHGQTNKILLSNRAIAAYRRHRDTVITFK